MTALIASNSRADLATRIKVEHEVIEVWERIRAAKSRRSCDD